jgi:hypothetical protein
MKRIFVAVLLAASGCTVSQPSETKEDSVAVLSEDTLQMAVDQIPPADTILIPVVIENKIRKAVIDPDAGYVYSDTGLDVYIENNVIGHIDYKSKVIIKSKVDDLYEIDFNGTTATIDSEFVLPLPVPTTTDVVEYFTKTLLLSKDPVERRSKEDDMEGSFSFINYEFESGFRIESGSQYESGFTTVKLPGLSLRQAFLFASFFYESFAEFKQFPEGARDEDLPEQKHISVVVDNKGNVSGMTVGNGEGCYWEDSISATDYGVEMSTGGGC